MTTDIHTHDRMIYVPDGDGDETEHHGSVVITEYERPEDATAIDPGYGGYIAIEIRDENDEHRPEWEDAIGEQGIESLKKDAEKHMLDLVREDRAYSGQSLKSLRSIY